MNISVPSEWKVFVSLFARQGKMLSPVINITLHSISITWCNLWQQLDDSYSTVLKCRRLHFLFMPYILSKVQIYTLLYLGYWLKETFSKCLRIWSISQYLAAPFSHCKVIDNMVQNSGSYIIWYAPLSLASSASSSVFPLYPSTMHPYSSSSSRLLTLIVSWMFIHRHNLQLLCCLLSICFPIEGSWDAPLFQRTGI